MSEYRDPTYLVGGQQPYGFAMTPPNDPNWVPTATDLRISDEMALYERIDWSVAGGATPAGLNQYQNPPFIGIGSTSTRVPSWMQGENPSTPNRILRGYMRRQNTVKFSTATSPRDKATNARLFFMYNPASIERVYMSSDALMNSINPTSDPSGPDQANVPLVSYTTVTFSLMFDRQEEVIRYKNHPGVLVDLAVFDLLARGGSPGTETTAALPNNVSYEASSSGTGAVTVTQTGGQQTQDSSSLIIDQAIPIAAIFSPSIVFYGNIIAADSVFEKFSHRMTPTRMTLTLTMRINAVGPEKQPTAVDGVQAAAAANSAALEALNPAKDVSSDEQKIEMNGAGRASAIAWAENWLPGKATLAGVPYSNDYTLRDENKQNDDYLQVQPPHVPGHFDCSSYVSRSYGVIGWLPYLKLSTGASADTNGFEKAAKENPDVWDAYQFNDSGFFGSVGSQVSPSDFNKNVAVGDLIVRSGSNTAGHIVFVHDDNGDNGSTDAGQHSWTFLAIGTPGKPPDLVKYTTNTILKGGTNFGPYSVRLRAQPVKIHHVDVSVVAGSQTTLPPGGP